MADGDEREEDLRGVSQSAPTFKCKLDASDTLITLLSTLVLEKDQLVRCTVQANNGIKFTVERSKIMRARAYMKQAYFSEFSLADDIEDLEFCLNLPILLHCLQIFGPSAAVELTYNPEGGIVHLMLTEDSVVTTCDIATLEADEPIDLTFRSQFLVARATIKSEFLKESFTELDIAGASSVLIHMSPRAPFLFMSVKGDSSSVKVDFPNDSADPVFYEFECSEDIECSYPLACIRSCMKVARAERTNLRMNTEGMLSVQHAFVINNISCWVEYIVSSTGDE